MADRLTVVGSGIASLTAALEAARRGRGVDLYVDPARLGGSFGGVRAAGRRLDLGLRLFELDYEQEGGGRLPIEAFDPARHSHRPFIHDIAAFLRGVLAEELVRAREPEMWINASRTRCVLMTVDLQGLPAALGFADRACILEELSRPAVPGPEPEGLEAASLARHGARLHALLTVPICAKQSEGWQGVLTAERRKLWMALFQPRTLWEAFSGRPIGFRPYRPFFRLRCGGAHRLVDRLMQALAADPLVAIRQGGAPDRFAVHADGSVEVRFGAQGAGVRVAGEDCAVGLPPEALFAAAGIEYRPARLQASILWVEAAEAEVLQPPSSLLVADPGLAPFRISASGDAREGRVCFAVEFGAGRASLGAARLALEVSGVIRAGAGLEEVHRWAGPAQAAPTAGNRSMFQAALDRFAGLGFRGAVLGGARRFGWDCLNDQIADGLHFGATRC